jgi:hypothetical protein
MTNPGFFVSATIVLILLCPRVEASPDSNARIDDTQTEQEEVHPLDENMAVSTPPALKQKSGPPNARYYPYQQQFTYRTGYDSDYPKIGVDNWVLGFQYLFPKFLSPKLEAGADLVDGGGGHLHIGMRWIRSERSYWRPSVKLGLDLHSDGKEGMATLTKWENYYARMSACAEYVVWNPFSLRLEHEILINFDEMRAVLTLGISHGW